MLSRFCVIVNLVFRDAMRAFYRARQIPLQQPIPHSRAVVEQNASLWTRPRFPLIGLWLQLSTSAVAPPPCESELPNRNVSYSRCADGKSDSDQHRHHCSLIVRMFSNNRCTVGSASLRSCRRCTSSIFSRLSTDYGSKYAPAYLSSILLEVTYVAFIHKLCS